MRTKARNAVALSLAIAGAAALPMRSDAVSRKGSTPPPPQCCIAFCAQPKDLSNTFYMMAQYCAAAVAISKIAVRVEEYKLVASRSKGKKKTDPEFDQEAPAP